MSQEEANHRNLMPSMVVRQQQQLLAKTRSAAGEGASYTANQASNIKNNNNNVVTSFQYQNPSKSHNASAIPRSHTSLADIMVAPDCNMAQHNEPIDRDEIILPKRIHQVPISLAQQPIIRELKFNQIRGKNVLDQKSELKKALERLADTKRRKEAEQERLTRRTSLEMRLEERAQKISRETGG